MSHYAVHAPWEKDERFYNKYKSGGLTDFEATLASSVEAGTPFNKLSNSYCKFPGE